MNGIDIAVVVILAILVPVLFQLVILGTKQEKRHKEIMDFLHNLDSKISKRE